MIEIARYNRHAWDREVEKGSVWTLPVAPSVIARARAGDWEIVLTPTKPVPRAWFPPLAGKQVLALACGGGQQGPILAAAGADVTVLDNSPRQLERDRVVAQREHLSLRTALGDMRDLGRFASEHFDLILVTGTCFVDDITLVWQQAARVLKRAGHLIAGCGNPIEYIFDLQAWNAGELVVRHKIPYSDLVDLSEEERQELIIAHDEPLCVGHSLHDLIQGQIDAGLAIVGFYEDQGGGPLDAYIASSFVTRAVKL